MDACPTSENLRRGNVYCQYIFLRVKSLQTSKI